MKHTRCTMQDIAKRAGITKMTVSRYFNNPDSVAQSTVRKIAAAVEELGYIPNRAPAILSKHASHALGLVIPSFSNLVFPDVINGIESAANQEGYNVLIAHTSYGIQGEEKQVEFLLSYQVDGIILTEPQHSPLTIKRLQNAGIPCVEIMSLSENPIDMSIGLDHKAIFKAATEALIQCGRRHLAYFGVRLDARTLQRQQGYAEALAEYNLKPYILDCQEPSNFTLGANLLRRAVKENPKLDAVLCTNDDVAIGAMIACQELKIKVPDEVAVLGYNGLNVGQATRPRLCSIYTPRLTMGQMAAQNLISRLRNNEISNPVIKLKASLSEGESVTVREKQALKQKIAEC